ncbi:hypothetical protein [Cryptosporangium minutisporangium]|uniref:Uncharacterized protein n=1 Tax=Cryptosporangium minutisporangium TaxID=113569 RepID=A0ABP6SUV4_9ACTN
METFAREEATAAAIPPEEGSGWMTMMGTQTTGTVGAVGTAYSAPAQPARALWSDHDATLNDPPEQAFAEVFGDADRVRIALWIDRTAPAHGGLFGVDTCASELSLPESTVRSALGPLQHVGMVKYRGGLYMRCDHTLWSVLKVLRNFAGPALMQEAAGPPAEPTNEPRDARAATFYFG